MRFIKWFVIVFLSTYLILSIPSILGFGYSITWVPEATLFQKVKQHIIIGLATGFSIKLIISVVLGGLVGLIISKKS